MRKSCRAFTRSSKVMCLKDMRSRCAQNKEGQRVVTKVTGRMEEAGLVEKTGA